VITDFDWTMKGVYTSCDIYIYMYDCDKRTSQINCDLFNLKKMFVHIPNKKSNGRPDLSDKMNFCFLSKIIDGRY
jgi:hypothetical protein